MELLRYLLTNIVKRPMRTAFIVAAGALSAVVLVFAFSLGLRVTEHIRVDTIAKWTGHLWVSAARDFEFKDEKTADYAREAAAVRAYLAADSGASTAVPWLVSYCEMQGGAKRSYVQVQATDFDLDAPFQEQYRARIGSPSPARGTNTASS